MNGYSFKRWGRITTSYTGGMTRTVKKKNHMRQREGYNGKKIAYEEERGYYRQTVAELIEERSLANTKKKEMEIKNKENDEET